MTFGGSIFLLSLLGTFRNALPCRGGKIVLPIPAIGYRETPLGISPSFTPTHRKERAAFPISEPSCAQQQQQQQGKFSLATIRSNTANTPPIPPFNAIKIRLLPVPPLPLFHGETPLATPPHLPPLQYFLLASWRFNLAFVFYWVLGTYFALCPFRSQNSR